LELRLQLFETMSSRGIDLRTTCRALLVALIVSAVSGSQALAETEKSEHTALWLGLDPIPGDALFYAGEPLLATLDLAIGVLGAGFLVAGIRGHIEDQDDDIAIFKPKVNVHKLLIYSGGALYLSSLVFDGVAGVRRVQMHNQRVAVRRGLSSLQPSIVPTSDGFVGGLSMRF